LKLTRSDSYRLADARNALGRIDFSAVIAAILSIFMLPFANLDAWTGESCGEIYADCVKDAQNYEDRKFSKDDREISMHHPIAVQQSVPPSRR